jgi:hypothetical protein
MALQDNTFAVFHSRGSRFSDDHVANLVLDRFQPKVFTEIVDKFPDLVFLFGRAWNLGQAVKVFPQCFWVELEDVFAHGVISLNM